MERRGTSTSCAHSRPSILYDWCQASQHRAAGAWVGVVAVPLHIARASALGRAFCSPAALHAHPSHHLSHCDVCGAVLLVAESCCVCFAHQHGVAGHQELYGLSGCTLISDCRPARREPLPTNSRPAGCCIQACNQCSQLHSVSCCRLQVQYTALPHFEDKYEDFLADTVVLRRRFTPDGKQRQRRPHKCLCWLRLCSVHLLHNLGNNF